MSYITIGDEMLTESDVKQFKKITTGMSMATIWFYALMTGVLALLWVLVAKF